VYNDDILVSMQERKFQDMLREMQMKNKAASTITRCIRNYARAIRKGMGFTIRRRGQQVFSALFLMFSLCCCWSDKNLQLICDMMIMHRVQRRRVVLVNKYRLPQRGIFIILDCNLRPAEIPKTRFICNRWGHDTCLTVSIVSNGVTNVIVTATLFL
jgi:hypothetical protein